MTGCTYQSPIDGRRRGDGAGAAANYWRALRSILLAFVLLSLASSFVSAAQTEVPRPLPSLTVTQPEPATPPDAVHAPIPKLPPTPLWYGPLGTVSLAVALAFVQLAKKFYRFLGLGIYLNWIAAAFLVLAGGASLVIHQTAAASLASVTGFGHGPLTPVASSIFANIIGALVYGFGRDRKKSQALKANVDGLLFQLIQDRIRTRNGIETDRLARVTGFGPIKAACQRLLDDDIPFGSIPSDKRDAILEALAKGEPVSNADDALRARHRILLSVIEVTSFKDVSAAILRAKRSIADSAVEGKS
jgi:hypothetical protein